MSKKITLKNYESSIKRYLERVDAEIECKENREHIKAFHQDLIADGKSYARQDKFLEILLGFAKRFGKDFNACTKEDIKGYVVEIQQSNYKEWTKHTKKSMLKVFWKWLKGNNKWSPEEVSWIHSKINKTSVPIQKVTQLITHQDILDAVHSAYSIRNKAFISSLFESGCRLGELGTLQASDLLADKYGYVMLVNGKTGDRRIRLVYSTPYIRTWLQSYNIQEGFVWRKPGDKYPEKPLSYTAFSKITETAFKKAGIMKPSNPHMFRHSRATDLARYLNHYQMCEFFGWTPSSYMPNVYVHLSGKGTDEAMLRLNGIKPEIKKVNKLIPNICKACEEINAINDKRCGKCNSLLDKNNLLVQSFSEHNIKEVEQVPYAELNELLSNPGVRKYVEHRIKYFE